MSIYVLCTSFTELTSSEFSHDEVVVTDITFFKDSLSVFSVLREPDSIESKLFCGSFEVSACIYKMESSKIIYMYHIDVGLCMNTWIDIYTYKT